MGASGRAPGRLPKDVVGGAGAGFKGSFAPAAFTVAVARRILTVPPRGVIPSMSVIRPRPPTDPIMHEVPAAWTGGAADRFRDWVPRIEAARPRLAAPDTATAILAGYGTLRAPARRRESPLFALLASARRVREEVDRVVVVGDRPDRGLVDLLLAACCHPLHVHLSRAGRGGRPQVFTLGPEDDDDRVQGLLDLLAERTGDALRDAWSVVPTGPCADRRTGLLLALLGSVRGTAGGDAGAAPEVDRASSAPTAAGEACLAPLLPAAIAGIDVVRILEGMAAMERRFAEAALGSNPVVTFVAVGRALAEGDGHAPPRRGLHPPPSWQGLAEWAAALGVVAPPTAAGAGHGTVLEVESCRRRPFGPDVPPQPPAVAAGLDAIRLPRADEHAVGQVLALLALAARLDRLVG